MHTDVQPLVTNLMSIDVALPQAIAPLHEMLADLDSKEKERRQTILVNER